MAKNLLVTDTLSEQMIKAGAKLLERLDAEKAEVKTACWLFLVEEKIWRLLIASPLVSAEGPRKFYQRIMQANQHADSKEEVVSLNDVSATPTEHQIAQVLHSVKSQGIRLYRTTIQGHFIDDSYIYRA